MNDAYFEKKKSKIGSLLFELGGVKSKYNQPGHINASPVAKPKHQYELFFVVVKLSVVVRRATRRLKALVKMQLIHA